MVTDASVLSYRGPQLQTTSLCEVVLAVLLRAQLYPSETFLEAKMNLHTTRNFDTKRKHEQLMALARPAVHFTCLLVLLFVAVAVKAQQPAPAAKPKVEPANTLSKLPTTRGQKIVQQGIAIEFTVDP